MLRAILRIPPVHISRVPNAVVWERVLQYAKQSLSWSTFHQERAVKLLSHCMRELPSAPTRVCMLTQQDDFKFCINRRVGRPSYTWFTEIRKLAAMQCGIVAFDHGEIDHQRRLAALARGRRFQGLTNSHPPLSLPLPSS